MMYDDTKILKTNYVDDLVKQKDGLKAALKYQEIDVDDNEGLTTMVPKTKNITGSKPDLPSVNFSAATTTDQQLTQEEVEHILSTYNLNNLKSFEKLFYQQTQITSIDFSNVCIKPNTPVRYIFGGCSKLEKIKFSNNNDLTGIDDLRYMFSSVTARDLDLSSFKFDETLLLKGAQCVRGCKKLPKNFFKCRYDISSSNSSGLLSYVNLRETVPVFNFNKLQLEFPEGSVNTSLYTLSESSYFDELIIDFSFPNIKNIPEDGVYLNMTFDNVSCNKLTLLNKDKAKINNTYNGLGFRGLSEIDFSGLYFGKSTSLHRLFMHTYVPTIYFNDVDTSNITDVAQWFAGNDTVKYCYSNNLDGSKLTNFGQFTNGSRGLEYFSGFWNLGKGFTPTKNNQYNFPMGDCKLTIESIREILNRLYDLNITCGVYDEDGNPGEGILYTQKISLPSNKQYLTPEEITAVTAKGWTIV